MASDMTARYVAEAQASTSSGTEQRQSIRGGYYAAQAQLDHKATREISRVPHTERSSRASRISKRGGRFGPARAPFPEPQKPATEHVRLQAVICRCCTSAWANLIALRSPHALQV